MNKKIITISSFILLFDQIVKSIIEINNTHINIINNFLSFNYYENTGAAFSILQGKTPLLILISLIMLVIIYSMTFSYEESRFTNIAFGCMFGGVFGNLIDRVFYGFVRDFIDVSIFSYNFPVFNIADAAIVIGAFLLVIATIKGEREKSGNKGIRRRRKIRIDKYLATKTEFSRSLIAKMLDDEFILVNGSKKSANYIIRTNDIITIKDGFIEEETIEPENIPINIVYEDDDIIIINKESGMVVHPGSGNYHGTLVNALMYYTKNLSDVNGEVRPGIVHRLDKDTSGLMMVAKNNKAHEILSDMLSKHEIKREYLALLKGEFIHDTATIDAPIGRDKIDRKKMAVTSENSKNAITNLTVVERFTGYTLVRLQLNTGRTHQIRVHMDYIGYPVYNDPVYGNKKSDEFGQFLHSTSIDFTHPISKKHMHFDCDLPEYFTNFIDTLEKK